MMKSPALFCVIVIAFCGCHNDKSTVDNIYKYYQPQYDLVSLHTTTDTLYFALDKDTYQKIESFNVFEQNGKAYISFFDKLSGSVNIYDISSQKLIKRVDFTKHISKKKLYRSTIYTRSFDSIFISINSVSLSIYDTSGIERKSIKFPKTGYSVSANFGNTVPAIFKGSHLYTGISASGAISTLKAVREWKPMYDFDLDQGNAELHYSLSEMYHNKLYNFMLISYGYCYNDKGNFVFSFAADTNIYETDFHDYNMAYYGKSRFQTSDIKPVEGKKAVFKGLSKDYLTQDSYGPIYFDPFAKRYLRVSRRGLSDKDFEARSTKRKEHLIIFDETFKIIGECEPEPEIKLGSIIFANGNMYARISSKDENALYFVRLAYSEKQVDSIKLAKHP